MAAAQSELTIGNLVRRVLFLIREEYTNQVKYVRSTRCASLYAACSLVGCVVPVCWRHLIGCGAYC
jgi:hypothetical protein